MGEEDDELYTALHAASEAGDDARIAELLDDGANPEARDGKGRVPYYLCPSNKSREAFRRWRGDNEESWNWGAAQVPEGITEEVELNSGIAQQIVSMRIVVPCKPKPLRNGLVLE